jgi:heparosan-N-sulfate-glucuronate 5-epimerase
LTLERRIQALKLRLRLYPGVPDLFGREGSFDPPVGSNWEPDGPPRGYYIDFTMKAQEPVWPPFWLKPGETAFHVATAQAGLGAYERYVDGDGEAWLEMARGAAEHLLEIQRDGGKFDGGWVHAFPMEHTFPLEAPWLSAMAQGEGASLLTRLHLATGEDRYAEAALRAIRRMLAPVADGGTIAEKDGLPFLEEYPTKIPSCVLNGAIFAIWGLRDVGVGLGDAESSAWFEQTTAALAELVPRYDLGYWSSYDLYPHPLPNVASAAYHLLHIRQLTALERLHPSPRFRDAIERFSRYREDPDDRKRAFRAKVVFRLRVPRNRYLAGLGTKQIRKPRADPAASTSSGRSEVLVLCYHGISDTWPADLAVRREDFEQQIRRLKHRGYKGVTFTEAVNWTGGGKVVAITFDDGYRSVVEHGLPILEYLDMPATLFVPTDYMGTGEPMAWPGIDRWLGGEHEAELMPVTWSELQTLQQAGWEIGSHTRSHPRLSQIDRDALPDELRGSKDVCEEKLPGTCTSIAYPYGDFDAAVESAARAAGYSAAAALPDKITDPNPMAFPRVGIYREDSAFLFRLKTSKLTQMVRRTAAWDLFADSLRSARRLVSR